MKIGIDISQLAYPHTGVANYLSNLVQNLLEVDPKNEYILFYSSLRKRFKIQDSRFKEKKNVTVKEFRFPPTLLDLLWNKLHVLPIEALIGDVDVFITSDWTEPPVRRARKATILYDLIVYKYPEETHAKIVATQKRKLAWAQRESAMILCISEATRRDAMTILGVEEERLRVVYPGGSL